MRVPPGYTQKEWDALSVEEKRAIRLIYENRAMVREVQKIISVVPREILLQSYATFLCSMSGFNRDRAVESAYGLLNKVEKRIGLDDEEDE